MPLTLPNGMTDGRVSVDPLAGSVPLPDSGFVKRLGNRSVADTENPRTDPWTRVTVGLSAPSAAQVMVAVPRPKGRRVRRPMAPMTGTESSPTRAIAAMAVTRTRYRECIALITGTAAVWHAGRAEPGPPDGRQSDGSDTALA